MDLIIILDILFAPQGKIKKIKIYSDTDGRKKGDALVTFATAESATLACLKVGSFTLFQKKHIYNPFS